MPGEAFSGYTGEHSLGESTVVGSRMPHYFQTPLLTVLLVAGVAATAAPAFAENIEASGGRRDVVLGAAPARDRGNQAPDKQGRGEQAPSQQSQASSPDSRTQPPAEPSGPLSKRANRILNINFGMAARDVRPNGAIGGPHDIWTLVDVGETEKSSLPMADGSPTEVSLELSPNDGEWGIPGAFDVYHAYLYHNARNVDLVLTVRNLPAGRYDVFVFAHGAASEQNAAIEIESAGKRSSGKSTINDGSMRFLSREHQEGVQYVRYSITVKKEKPVVITSKRDGSDLSMFNAVQFERTGKTTKKKKKARRRDASSS
jgi:hypothetical protein